MNALPTLADQSMDGRAAWAVVLASSAYRTPAQAVASLTLFTHPLTVAQIPGRGALFPAIRDAGQRRRLGEWQGRKVGFDDNEAAQHAFRWSNPSLPARWRDLQLNHVWTCSTDPDAFTAPANLCVAPSFLAKLTDHDRDIAALLRRRAFELYGWTPATEPEPARPPGYEALLWADPLPPVADLEGELRRAMQAKPACTAVQIARAIGWAFSSLAPDPAFPLPAGTLSQTDDTP
jgi:hypothetical protein